MEALPTYTQPFFAWLLETTLIASVVIGLILVSQRFLGERLGPRWCHALWSVLLLRMVLPWTPPSPWSLGDLIPASIPQAWPHASVHVTEKDNRSELGVVSEGTQPKAVSPSEPTAASPQMTVIGRKAPATRKAPPAVTWPVVRRMLPLFWLAGAAALGAYLVSSNIALWRIVKRERPLLNQPILELFEACKVHMGVQTIVAIVPSDHVTTAALFGFVRPRLLLPRDLIETANQEELRYIFLHELAHLKRHDIYLGWLASLLQVLHWFNPLVWLAFHKMRADRELACDALVLTRTGPDESRQYGRTIVGLLERFCRTRPLPAMAGILENRSQLKRRIAMIAQFRNHSYRWSATGITVIALLTIVSITDPTRSTPSASPPPEHNAGVAMRLVQKDSTGFASVSPDGKYLCDVDIQGGMTSEDIVIREFATGENRTIKPTKRAPDESGPVDPVISPDGKTIAYGTERPKAYLRLIGTDGSGQRDLCSGVGPIQWFPDGSRILGIQLPTQWPAKDSMISIVSVSVSDGSVHKIKTASAGPWATRARLSPDGKYVAYGLPFVPGKQDIFVVEVASGQETPLVQHPSDDRLLGWTPDGRYVLFASDRMGAWDAWLLPVAEGKAQGVPELVARNIGAVEPKGFTQNGSYYYEVAYNGENVYTAAIDVAAGQLLSAPVALPAAGNNGYADWSPDGQSLAYCSYPEPSRQPHVIRIRSLATGEERELFHKLPMVRCLCWTPDGRSVLASWLTVFGAGQEEWPGRVCRVDVNTGESTVVLQNESKNGGVWRAELSPDEKTLFYSQGFTVFRRQIAGGEQKSIYDFPKEAEGGWITWALSPTAEFIAVGFNEPSKEGKEYVTSIVVVPSGGGEITELLRRNEPGGHLSAVAWSRDSKTVLLTIQRDFDTIEFWQMTVEGGQPRKITEAKLGWCYSLRVHPDGQRIAFMAGHRRHELWVMKNLLPAGKSVSGATSQQSNHRWTNSLGMVFVPVKGTSVRFCVWETRVKDFEAFVSATGRDMGNKMTCFNSDLKHDEWEGYNWKKPGYAQGPDHPVVGVNWEDAVAFCKWLTEKERKEGVLAARQVYRLPSDSEWSAAVGLKAVSRDAPGEEQDQETKGVYPWGTQWPPTKGAGNYADMTARAKYGPDEFKTIDGYDDGYAEAAPVGSFQPNPCGLYDMGGNALEWCGYWVSSDTDEYRSLRGASWGQGDADSLHSRYRIGLPPARASSPDSRASCIGFRVVLER